MPLHVEQMLSNTDRETLENLPMDTSTTISDGSYIQKKPHMVGNCPACAFFNIGCTVINCKDAIFIKVSEPTQGDL